MPEKKKFLVPFVLSGVAFAVLLLLFWQKSPVSAQSLFNPPAKNETPVADAARPRLVAKTALTTPSASTVASSRRNAELKNNLSWAFGGKAQRGWYIYESLIQQALGTEAAADSSEFALAVSEWQAARGLVPTGVLENETLAQMVKWWQSRRLNSSQYPAADELYRAPITDFFDPSRSPELLDVERETYAAYKRMVAAAVKDPSLKLKTDGRGGLAPEEKYLKIVSAFRSREYQEMLRRQSPNSGRAGLAKHSPHFTGRALDIYVGGLPVDTKDFNRAAQVQTPVYKWLVKNAERFGFYPYYYEPWHWEYVPDRVRQK